MRGFVFLSCLLFGCAVARDAGAEPPAQTAPGGIRLLSHLPPEEVRAESGFWQSLFAPLTGCEAAALLGRATPGTDRAASCGPGPHPQADPAPPPWTDTPGA